MKKVFALLFVLFLFVGCQKGDMTDQSELKTVDEDTQEIAVSEPFVVIKTEAGDVKLNIETAVSPVEKMKGLTGRPVIEKGMFFLYDKEGDYAFTTRGMEAPIDIIFIGADERIVYIDKNIPTEVDTIKSDYPFQFVLETRANFADDNKVEVGQKVDWMLEKSGSK